MNLSSAGSNGQRFTVSELAATALAHHWHEVIPPVCPLVNGIGFESCGHLSSKSAWKEHVHGCHCTRSMVCMCYGTHWAHDMKHGRGTCSMATDHVYCAVAQVPCPWTLQRRTAKPESILKRKDCAWQQSCTMWMTCKLTKDATSQAAQALKMVKGIPNWTRDRFVEHDQRIY